MKYIFGNKPQVEFDSESFDFSVRLENKVFNTVKGNDPYLLLKDGRRIFFSEAKTKTVKTHPTGVGDGILIELSDFPDNSISFALYLWVERTNCRLHAEWIPYTESETVVDEIAWPKPLHSFADDGYSVLTLMNGKIIPDKCTDEFHSGEERLFYRREGYMPFFGQVGDGGSGYLAVVETPWDAEKQFDHLPASPTVIGVRWIPTLDKMDYRRSMFYTFYEKDADYVRMCKDYRRYAIEQGRITTLREKIARDPNLEKMIGSCVVHTPMIARNVTPESEYYNKEDPSKNHSLITFSEMAERIERLYSLGVKGAYVHIDGWGKRGYDNGHPDILPPCPEAGGWQGMADMLNRLRKIGFIPAIHDNYRDYYKNADTYSDDQAQVFADGSYTGDSIWYGGPQRKLCSALAKSYVIRNFTEMKAHGCLPDGAYLDVFSVGLLDECANPMHRVTRKECLKNRKECFDYVRSLGMIVSSEETLDDFADSLHLVHHCPWFWDNHGGINVPLMELVYHDVVLIPVETRRGASHSPEDELGFLHGLLQGGIPYLSLNADEEEIKNVELLRRLHSEVALSELMYHGFIDGDAKLQESRFANGVEVQVNFRTDSYSIKWADGSVSSGKISVNKK